MAAKIKLGQRPKTFKPFPVKFVMPDGSEGEIEVTYKYRTNKEFGSMINDTRLEAGEIPEVDGKIDYKALHERIGRKSADHLLKSIEAWSLDEDITLAVLEQLCDELPAAMVALMSCYADACEKGRLGN